MSLTEIAIRIASYIPEVKRPEVEVPLKRRIMWSALALLVFFNPYFLQSSSRRIISCLSQGILGLSYLFLGFFGSPILSPRYFLEPFDSLFFLPPLFLASFFITPTIGPFPLWVLLVRCPLTGNPQACLKPL